MPFLEVICLSTKLCSSSCHLVIKTVHVFYGEIQANKVTMDQLKITSLF